VHDWVQLGNININELNEPMHSNPQLQQETFDNLKVAAGFAEIAGCKYVCFGWLGCK